MKIKKTDIDGVYTLSKDNKIKKIFTKSIAPGFRPFNESIVKQKGIEYREIDPNRSKLASAIKKGVNTHIKSDAIVLYLGSSYGYTPSFVSDIIEDGFIFALDFAPRVVRDLIFITEKRKNMAPILADANNPLSYSHLVTEVGYVYQDIAQKNQLEIFEKNCNLFLKKGGYGFLALKARSIDVSRKPKEIFKEARNRIKKYFEIIDYTTLDPFQKDHAVFIVKKK